MTAPSKSLSEQLKRRRPVVGAPVAYGASDHLKRSIGTFQLTLFGVGATVVPVEHVDPAQLVAVEGVHAHAELAVQPGVGALPRVERPLGALDELDSRAVRVVGGQGRVLGVGWYLPGRRHELRSESVSAADAHRCLLLRRRLLHGGERVVAGDEIQRAFVAFDQLERRVQGKTHSIARVFDERLAGYAFKEDIDFSYRIAKRGYVLVQTPRALVDHLKAPAERLSPFQLQRMMLGNQFYLHRKNMPQTLRYKAALWWALLGMLVLNFGKAARTRDAGWLSGLLVGAWEQARGRGLGDQKHRAGS